MADMRERLIELIDEKNRQGETAYTRNVIMDFADYLIENGVIVIDTDFIPTKRECIETFANMPMDEVLQLVQAKQEGRILELPCKVGTELYLSDYITAHHRLKEYKFLGNEIAVVIDCWEWQRTCTRMLSDFGKTVFLTKEEAEQALKEREQ